MKTFFFTLLLFIGVTHLIAHAQESSGPLTIEQMEQLSTLRVREGEQTIEGKLSISKEKPMVQGILLTDHDFFRRRFGKDWFNKLEKLEGKKIKVSGKVSIYRCAPVDQCLIGGQIPSMGKIKRWEE